MHMKKMMTLAAAVAVGFAAAGQEKEKAELAWAPGDGISYGETQIVAFEAGAQLDSRYMTYGVIDGRDPILTPSVKATFFDWFYLSAEAIYDVTKTKFYDSTPDKFFIFFPGDWHIAKISTDQEDQSIRVIVIKVDYIW